MSKSKPSYEIKKQIGKKELFIKVSGTQDVEFFEDILNIVKKFEDKFKKKTKIRICKTCYHGIYAPTIGSIVCTNPDGIYQQPVRDNRPACREWKFEKKKESKECTE